MTRARLSLYSLALLAFTSNGCLPDGAESPEPATTDDLESGQAALSTGVVAYSYTGSASGADNVQFITVRNSGAQSYTGIRMSYFFTGQAGKTPAVSNKRTEGCTSTVESLGGLLYRVLLDCPSAVLNPGQILPDAAGYAFLVYLTDWSQLDYSKAYSHNGQVAFALNDHILVESGGLTLFGSRPAGSNLDPACGPSDPSLGVMSRQETNEFNISKPRFYVENQGATTVPGFILRYRFTVEGGKRPVLESWYVPGCAARLESLGGAEYAMVVDCSNVPVAPGQAVPNRSGFVVGLHYPDWSAWDRRNDYSNPAQITFAPSSTIALANPRVPSTVLPAVATTTSANGPALAWQNTLGGPNADYLEDMFETPNGGFVVAGWTNSYGATPGTYDDAWLSKTDAFGAEVWRKTFGGTLYERFTSVRPTSDNGIIATGFTTVDGKGQDILLVKTDGAGQVVFQKNFGGADFESGAVVRETRDGGFIVSGDLRWSTGAATTADMVLLRTDAQGNQVWLKRFGAATTWQSGNSVAETCDGGFVVAAEDNGQGVLFAVDSAGNRTWSQPLAAGIAKTVVATPDNGFLVLGDGGTGAANRDLWLAKTDSAGQVLWTRALGGASQDMAKDLRPTREGNYMVLGWQFTPGTGPTYPWVAEIDDTGAPLWTTTIGDGAFRVGSTAISTAHGTVVVGYTGGTTSDGWFANLGTTRLTEVVLPPTLSYCDADCQAQPLPAIYACPESVPNCTPTQSTTVLFSVNGRRVDGHYLVIQNGNDWEAPTLRRLDRGGGEITFSGGGLVAKHVPGIVLYSDVPLDLTWKRIHAISGGVTHLEYRAQGIANADLDTFLFRAAGDDVGDAGYGLADRSLPVVRQEKEIAGLTTNHPTMFYMTSDLAGLHGEGNVSFGNGVMTVSTFSGFGPSAIHELAHEYAHELFRMTNPAYQGWTTCLNEGHADAMSVLIGTIPEGHLGPVHLSGINFTNNCQSVTGVHDVGNCYFWHLKQAGVLDTAFLNRLYHPQRTTQFDTCATSDVTTGNWLVVVFSESAGLDMATVVTGMNIPNAGSYEAAKAALGL